MIFVDRLEAFGIDSTPPQHKTAEAALLKLLEHVLSRHHNRFGRPMKPAQPPIRDRLWQDRASTKIFGKTGVVGSRETDLPAQTKTPRCQAHRPFCRNMDAIGAECREARRDPGVRLVRETNFGISGAGEGRKVIGTEQQHFVTIITQAGACSPQGVDHAVDLRLSGVCYDGNSHNSRLWWVNTVFFCCMISCHVTSRSSPLASSTSADRLSTQSPSLQ